MLTASHLACLASPQHAGIRSCVPGGKGFRGFKATSARLKILVMLAYNLPDSQITGGPGWVDSDGFDIDAKAENPTSYEQINLMLQTLLADRFQLKIRRETREQPVYALILEKATMDLTDRAFCCILTSWKRPTLSKKQSSTSPILRTAVSS